jgi:hypothetical protein
VRLGELIDAGDIEVMTGDEIGKLAYGTGPYVFVRTSDLANWELKADPKQGVSRKIYEKYASKQDVQADDVFLVRDGTYLIGVAALVSPWDREVIYQSHILKLRATPGADISGALLLLALSSPIVQRQIRAKQFTADIIDTLGNRYRELVLPVPSGSSERANLHRTVTSLVNERAELRERIRRIPYWVQGVLRTSDPNAQIPTTEPDEVRNIGSTIDSTLILNHVYLPRYYNPDIENEIRALSDTHEMVVVGDLVDRGLISISTGDEVGKMAYGTGSVPFIRTTDFANWELRLDPKHAIASGIYAGLKDKQDVMPDDILLVRDGTYLVGSSAVVTVHDGPLTYCGGLYKLRSEDPDELDPYLLLALLNTPVARAQMRAKQFTRDVIDTLGNRISEVQLPIPRDASQRGAVAAASRTAVERRAILREEARRLIGELTGGAVSRANAPTSSVVI